MENKTVLITGASSGMGEATAILLAQSGYKVFAGVRSQAAIDKLNKLNMSNLSPIVLDVTKIEDINNAFDLVKETVGENGLLALINNAGNNYSVSTEYFDEDKARSLLDTHFWGMANLTKRFLPLLRLYGSKNPTGARIINVGSIGSISAFPFIQFYNAAKFAILGFTESLRFELAPFDIKAIVILPGSVKTSIWKRTDEAVQESLSKLNDEGKELYQHNINQASKLSSSMETSGIQPDKAAKVFKKVLEASNPSFKYFIGTDAKTVNFMVKYLPDCLRQSLVGKQLKFKSYSNKQMENRIILITGATSGVGKATAFELAKPENQLLLVARNAQKGEALRNEILSRKPDANIELLFADLSLQKDIRKLASDFRAKYNKLDTLINCAGLVSSERVETKEGIEQTLAVNYISHYLLSHLLLDELKNGEQGRIINVASLIPPIAKINFNDIHSKKKYSGVNAYLQSKVADVMFTYDLSEQLKNTNVTVNAVHPGIVKTNLGVETSKGALQGFVRFCMSFLAITPEKSAERVLYLANSKSLSKITGKYFRGGQKPVKTNSFSHNPDNRNKLSELTRQLIAEQ